MFFLSIVFSLCSLYVSERAVYYHRAFYAPQQLQNSTCTNKIFQFFALVAIFCLLFFLKSSFLSSTKVFNHLTSFYFWGLARFVSNLTCPVKVVLAPNINQLIIIDLTPAFAPALGPGGVPSGIFQIPSGLGGIWAKIPSIFVNSSSIFFYSTFFSFFF